jgi:plastocyanin
MRFRIRPTAAAAVAAFFLAGTSQAGQVRVNVVNFSFVPQEVSVNQGDQVVWFWVNAGHSVTSGSGCNASGIFNSGTQSANTRFSWKSTGLGDVNYICIPHCPSMAGVVSVATSGANVSDFRITEVRVASAPPHTVDFIEITNMGTASGNLGRYRVVTAGITTELHINDIVVPAGGRLVIHPGSTGVNTATDIFLPTVTMTNPGSVALYYPNSVTPALTDPNMVVDFVQWGAGTQPNEATAVEALTWTTGAFIPTVADGHSYEFCGTRTDRGPAFWRGISEPNPGTNGNCSTPVQSSTWGSVKTLYR